MLVEPKYHISISGQAFFLYALIILLVPLKWAVSWIAAAAFHELGHYVLLQLLHIRIYSIKIGALGAQIATEPISYLKEAVCALAGPAAGLSLLFVFQFAPYIAISGLVQSCYNLIPIYPLDGGRAVRGILMQLMGIRCVVVILRIISGVVMISVLGIGIWISLTYSLGILPIIFPSMPIFLTVWKNSLQSREKNSTIQKNR